MSEQRIEEAIALGVEIEKTVLEGAGAAGLAAVLESTRTLSAAGASRSCSAAATSMPACLTSVLLRALAAFGRLVRLRIEVPDRPGVLASVAGLIVGRATATSSTSTHHRDLPGVALKRALLEVSVETPRSHARRTRSSVSSTRRASRSRWHDPARALREGPVPAGVMTEVRVARADEYARVGELTVAAYQSLAVDHLWGGYDREILDTARRATDAEVLVAVDDDRVVGAVTYVADASSCWSEWTRPGEAQFRLLAVDVEARGRGVGEMLVHECIDRARRDARGLVIHTTPWMNTARRMYERLGFERRPDRDVSYEEWNSPPVDGLPAEWVGQAFLAYVVGLTLEAGRARRVGRAGRDDAPDAGPRRPASRGARRDREGTSCLVP